MFECNVQLLLVAVLGETKHKNYVETNFQIQNYKCEVANTRLHIKSRNPI